MMIKEKKRTVDLEYFKKYVEKDDKKPQQDIKGGSKMRSIMSISI